MGICLQNVRQRELERCSLKVREAGPIPMNSQPVEGVKPRDLDGNFKRWAI